MSRKNFLDVFKDIKLNKDTENYFSDVMVTGVEYWRNARNLCIYIESGHIIPKVNIKDAENAVRVLCFDNDERNTVEINERYLLSNQYNPENLMEVYWDSIVSDLREVSELNAQLIKNAEYKIDGNTISFSVKAGTLASERVIDIRRFIEDVFIRRFGMTVIVNIQLIRRSEEEEENALTGARKAVEVVSMNENGEAEVVDEQWENYEEYYRQNYEEINEDQKNTQESQMIESFDAENNAVSIDVAAIAQSSASKEKEDKKNKKDFKANFEKYRRNSMDDPECFYGKNVEGDVSPIGSLGDNFAGEVIVRGLIFDVEEKEIRNGEKVVITACLTDFTDSIKFKIFVNADDKADIVQEICVGNFVKVKGQFGFDSWSKEVMIQSVNGIKAIPDFRVARSDEAAEKRVELHLHTSYSDLDAITDVGAALKRASSWGHKAMAITDHGVVQAFPVANHVKGLSDDFKIIYGMEGYFVDDRKGLVDNGHGQSLDSEYVVFDIETTGLSFKFCKIIEIGAVRVDATGKELGRFSEFINPEVPIPYHIEKLTSISDEMVQNADTVDKVLPRFLDFCKGAILVAHNATFDTTFIKTFSKRLELEYNFTALDTMTLAHVFLPELGRYTLDRLCSYFKFKNQHHHRACDDADVTAKIFHELLKIVKEAGAENVDDLNRLGRVSDDAIRKAKSYHGIILVKNEIGRVNLYRLVSDSHIKYFNRRPRIPMSEIEKYREGLIIGSACSSGQLYGAILDGESDEEIGRLVNFFDYLEIQPVGNNQYLIDNPKEDRINSVEDLQNINRQIVELGKKYDKPVVATGDVHFLDPEDAIYRTIVKEGSTPKGSSDKKSAAEMEEIEKRHKDFVLPDGQKRSPVQVEMEKEPPLYFKTTEEMLKEFAYLGEDTAKEVVITNTNRIADMVDRISPVRPDKCPPVIENSDKILREICEKKAHEIYGPDLPDIVRDRLDRELDSIIGNGYSVMYVIAQKLVWKSNDDGYLVGSRGSVGSSFAATMAGITEVNPLPPHYICPKCFYSEFDSERIKKYADAGTSGCDMPDADCPKCGTLMKKEGHAIPFETFLGFNGDKEPDIDLNFSGEYQPNAHAYIEEIFGKEHAFRAGTIGTLAEKTCIGYALRYCENRDLHIRNEEIIRLAKGCEGVKRTTGQHPGGMIVSPPTEEIYSFTPVQHPANDMTSETVTTHFEYHSIDHNLLKFDILGHDDPTMIRRLEDLTDIKATTVPLDDKKVMSLFHGTDALGIKPEDIGGTRLGCLGIPEFGTDFAMQMVIDADPENFSDLVRIAGLAHGTDVWLGNAQTLIQEGKCKLSSAICCRDDIMVYLIGKGLDPKKSFNIMEKVRKGMVANGKVDPEQWEEWSQDMLDHDVPDWYVWSCSKIKYMFPKAHAVAYVMMAWRVAWYKLYHPLAYYAAFFSIRATAFSYEIMCQGKEHLETILKEYRQMDSGKMTAKDKDLIRDMRLVQEMYARGLEFMPIDIYKADATKFQIIDGKIMPSLASIDGMGEKAAQQLAEAAKDGQFFSREELRNRAKVNNSVLEKMANMGILGDMPETSQLKFDFL